MVGLEDLLASLRALAEQLIERYNGSDSEVVRGMRLATGVEGRCAFRTYVDAQMSLERQFHLARSAENGGLRPLVTEALLGGVPGKFGVTVTKMARTVPVAAPEANGDGVEFSLVVLASRLISNCPSEPTHQAHSSIALKR